MAKTQTFRVVNGRIHFRCYACQGRQMLAIPPGIRKRSIRCSKCGEVTRCNFNRRTIPREQQRGKIFMSVGDSNYIEVDLYDMSLNGIGFDISIRDIRKINLGREIRFKCTWNPRLFSHGRYIVRSINGRRIGAQRG